MSGFDAETLAAATALLEACRARGLMLVTAESCTGGLIAGALTAIVGSSDVVTGGWITYSNEAKQRWLGVPETILLRHGAVSPETARAMTDGALTASGAGLALAATGIAGPGGGSPEKPVGLVFIAAATKGGDAQVERLELWGRSRDEVRRLTVIAALKLGLAQAAGRPVLP